MGISITESIKFLECLDYYFNHINKLIQNINVSLEKLDLIIDGKWNKTNILEDASYEYLHTMDELVSIYHDVIQIYHELDKQTQYFTSIIPHERIVGIKEDNIEKLEILVNNVCRDAVINCHNFDLMKNHLRTISESKSIEKINEFAEQFVDLEIKKNNIISMIFQYASLWEKEVFELVDFLKNNLSETCSLYLEERFLDIINKLSSEISYCANR